MKKWITFDLDGTLMQNPFVGHVFPEIERRILEQNDRLKEVVQQLVLEHETRLNAEQYAEAYDWDDIVAHFANTNQLAIAINVEEILKEYCVEPAIYLLEDTIPDTLNELRRKGYNLAVVTNGFKKYQLPVMDVLKLTSHFDMIVTPEEVGYAKPDGRMYRSVLQLGEIAAHIGDRIEHDIWSTNAIEVRSIWINRKLPEQIKGLPPSERGKHPAMQSIVLEKLEKETKKQFDQLPKEAFPHDIICCIAELVGIL